MNWGDLLSGEDAGVNHGEHLLAVAVAIGELISHHEGDDLSLREDVGSDQGQHAAMALASMQAKRLATMKLANEVESENMPVAIRGSMVRALPDCWAIKKGAICSWCSL